jgi:general secretion pathway protein K
MPAPVRLNSTPARCGNQAKFRNLRARQKGMAVLVAMLIVAIAALAASAFMFKSSVEQRRLENRMNFDQARWIERAAEQWGASVLLDDAMNSSIDYPGEAWATRLPPVEAEGFRIVGHIEDQERRFNLNNLTVNGKIDQEQLDIFVRLLQALRLPEDLAYATADWIDTDDTPFNADSAESSYYESLPTPYAAANRPLVSTSELLRVKGFNADILSALRPYVAALPTRTPVNVNTASPEVLMALVPGLTSAEAYDMVAKRDRIYYRNIQDFQQALPHGLAAASNMISVSSQFFLVLVRVDQKRLAIGDEALYQRKGPLFPKLIWRAAL